MEAQAVIGLLALASVFVCVLGVIFVTRWLAFSRTERNQTFVTPVTSERLHVGWLHQPPKPWPDPKPPSTSGGRAAADNPNHPPCYFCGETEFEHAKQCPITKYRGKAMSEDDLRKLNAMLKSEQTARVNAERILEECRKELDAIKNQRGGYVTDGTWEVKYYTDDCNLLHDHSKGECLERKLIAAHNKFCGGQWTVKLDEPPKFTIGQWVRAKTDGMIGQINGTASIASGVSADETTSYSVTWADKRRGMATMSALIEPALPRAGEWWQWYSCATHRTLHTDGPYKVKDPSTRGECVGCCLHPVNFGRGKKPIPVPKDGTPQP